jgi:phosphatidylserine/phosphatidylglycerophosphate/cardiolipin synthase-like enzyme
MYYTTICIVVSIVLGSLPVDSQTNPVPYDLSKGTYTFTTWDPSQPGGTYPPNMRFHRGPRQDPRLTDEPNADYTDSYNAGSGSRMNGLGTDGFSWRNIGTAGNLGAAVLAINTTGLSNILVSWTAGTVEAPEREYRIRLQYRIGNSGPFFDVPGPVEYITDSPGHFQHFGPILLPEQTNDQPVVQLRWKYYYVSGTGNRPMLRVGNIVVQTAVHPGNGTGAASLSRQLFKGDENHSFDLTIGGRVDSVSITNVDIQFPDWVTGLSQDRISLSDPHAFVEVSGRNVRISDTGITTDEELTVSFHDLYFPDLTGEYEIAVRTGVNSGQTIGIARHPALLIWGTPMPISEVSRNDSAGVSVYTGSWVTIRGSITVADQFETGSGAIGTGAKGPSYIQDSTGGIAVFSPSGVTAHVTIDDEVTLLGKVTQFFGLNQLDENTLIVDIHGRALVEPVEVTLDEIANDGIGGTERFEGMLVRINNVTVNTWFWNVSGAGSNYILNDTTGRLEVRINKAVDFVGYPAPSGLFDIIGVVSQFRNEEPYTGGYQLMPRFAADIIFDSKAPPIVSLPPYETAATESTVTLSWRTGGPGTTEVRYGTTTEYDMGTVVNPALSDEHSVTISGLEPATIYNIQIRSAAGPDTTISGNYLVATRSSHLSTQRINVYFNQSVDTSIAVGQSAQTADFGLHMASRIRSARHSVDLALYSISGNTGRDLTYALMTARDNGARIRIIMDRDRVLNSGTGTIYDLLVQEGFNVVSGGYNYGRTDSGIHHNKFAVIDYHGGSPDEVRVISGSWNATDEGTYHHQQNWIEFQDMAIAGAFTREFEQMWGSRTGEPDPSQAKFGPEKSVVNPTVFWIGDAYVRLFFSPQGFGQFGSVEDQIIAALNRSEHSVNLGLNLITRPTIADALHERYIDGVKVRGVIGDISVSGSQFSYLSSWADVLPFSQSYGLLHHKYAIIDGEIWNPNSAVITGSHNWSRAANERNDENTVIVFSPQIANQYIQEFFARYKQAGGEDDIVVVSAGEYGTEESITFSLFQNYPNPFNPVTNITYIIPVDGMVRLDLFNILGQYIKQIVDEEQSAGRYSVTISASDLPSGMYFYRLSLMPSESRNMMSREIVDTKRMVLIR